MNEKFFDISKYKQPFITNEMILPMKQQAADLKIPASPWWLGAIFLGLKVAVLSWLAAMWHRNQDDAMALDRQKYNLEMGHNLDEDNEVV